ncbi:cell wall protein [Diplodia corticola]|uniref:Cell wall protein n=1 Tax=Diplodia corticola TaxID=236234 RepID=A0A1J9R0W8_9PEZI|nr:cell wall protein [Diplodia corticola]OJD34272.1 cell wall protein [Diplodia corticola]
MKTSAVVTSVLAAAGSATAAASPFRLLALSKGASFDGEFVRGTEGQFLLGAKQTNTTCGTNTAPTFTNINGTITTYGNGMVADQMVYVDISGAAGGILSYKNYPYKLTADDSIVGFTQTTTGDVQHLLYKKSTWLACEKDSEKGVYSVYAEAAKDTNKQQCIPFEIATQKVEKPQICQMT